MTREIFNVYCDESCHIENDPWPIMVLGAVWCKKAHVKDAVERIREIKQKHHLSRLSELKWTKLSPKALPAYLDIIDYFFDNQHLHFRGYIARQKKKLDHTAYNQDYDTWYYKMYFRMLEQVLNAKNGYRIYIDIKDTRGGEKAKKLCECLRTSMYDYNNQIIERLQIIRSDESELMQLADILIGAFSYLARVESLQSFYPDRPPSPAKIAIIDKIKKRSGTSLERSTWPSERKFNFFFWDGAQANNG
jgi:hypothetical protein